MRSKPPVIAVVEDLIVVGYADAIDQPTVPSRVAPIFRFREEREKYLFPPFRISGQYVCDGTIGSAREFDQMVAERLATRIEQAFNAVPSGMLWVDENSEVHYGPQGDENDRLRNLAELRLKDAEVQFRKEKFQDALRNARWAAAADEQSLMALCIQAAVYQVQAARRIIDGEMARKAQDILHALSQTRPDRAWFHDEVERMVSQIGSIPDQYLPSSREIFAQPWQTHGFVGESTFAGNWLPIEIGEARKPRPLSLVFPISRFGGSLDPAVIRQARIPEHQ